MPKQIYYPCQATQSIAHCYFRYLETMCPQELQNLNRSQYCTWELTALSKLEVFLHLILRADCSQ